MYSSRGILAQVDPSVFAALAEPNRRRILEFLGESPRSVGEVAAHLELRQPTATKHLQALEKAGLVSIHPLGRRRIYALERAALSELRDWAEGLSAAAPSDDVLTAYEQAIRLEHARTAAGDRSPRVLEFVRTVGASPAEVWRYWTEPHLVRQWWAPDHFWVAEAEVVPVLGGALSIVMAEPDGTRHAATGRFLELEAARELRFEMSPLGPDGAPLFSTTHDLAFAPGADGTGEPTTLLAMAVVIEGGSAGAEATLAGIEIGWGQTLDRLVGLIDDSRA